MTALPWRCGQQLAWVGPSGPTRGTLLVWWMPQGIYRLTVQEVAPPGALTGALVTLLAGPNHDTFEEVYRCP